MRFPFRTRVLMALAILAGVLSPLVATAPAQAAESVITIEQVLQTTGRVTQVSQPEPNGRAFSVEVRSGYYGGYQYGWARILGTGYDRNHYIYLQATNNGGATFYTLWSQSLYDSRYLHTTGYLTSSDPNYKFRACYAYVTYHEPAWCSRAW